MAKRIILTFLVLAIAAGVVSGTPLHAPNEKRMKCCDKARSKDRSASAQAARLCCALNCTESTPTPSGVSLTFTPTNSTAQRSIAEQIADLFPTDISAPADSDQYSRNIITRTFQPKYIQHNSLLI